MLTVKRIGAGRARYYTDYASGEGGEERAASKWLGSGAKAIGLSGEVSRETLENLLLGFSPDGRLALVQNAGDAERRCGDDFTFSAPKSVSLLAAVGPPAIATEVLAAHRAAVEAAVGSMEAIGVYSRRGKGGCRRELAGSLVAAYEHDRSRARDPQLHTHAIFLNLGLRPDGTFGALVSTDMYRAKMAVGALYRAELGRQLHERLQLKLRSAGSCFEVEGVRQEVIDRFSTRRAAIEKTLASWGTHSAQAAAAATLATRPPKEVNSQEDRRDAWRMAAADLGLDAAKIENLVGKSRVAGPMRDRARAAVREALAKITNDQSHFSELDLLRFTAEAAQTRGVSAQAIRTAVGETISAARDVVAVGHDGERQRFTTPEVLAVERRLLMAVEASRHDAVGIVPEKTLQKVLAKHPELNHEQQAALRHITQAPGSIVVLCGMAGTGKSTLCKAANEAYAMENFSERGAALAGKAAQGLEESTGIKSDTLHRTLAELRSSETGERTSHGRRSDRGKEPHVLSPIKIGRKTVVFVDESSMVSTKQMAELVEQVRKRAAKLVLLGDAKQLQAIEQGGAFLAIAKRLGAAELTEVRRQNEAWAQEAVTAMSRGEAHNVLGEFESRGLLTVGRSRKDAVAKLIHDWKQEGAADPKRHLIMAATNAEVDAINRAAQAERQREGRLGTAAIAIGDERFRKGDRAVCTRNSRVLAVKNGHLGTIENVSLRNRTLTIRMDSGARVEIHADHYQSLKLGYCVSVHRAQGMTVEGNAYCVLGGGMQDRELSYVMLSRAREKTRLYVDRFEAGPKLETIARQMQKSRIKTLAHDVGERPGERGMSPEIQR